MASDLTGRMIGSAIRAAEGFRVQLWNIKGGICAMLINF
jgi:hypothetical protein